MSIINLEEVSGSVIIHNRAFSAKEILQAVLRESVPVELREGTLAIGIERIYPQPIMNSRMQSNSNIDGYSILIHEINKMKREISQINRILQLNNRENEGPRSSDDTELKRYLNSGISTRKPEQRNQDRSRVAIPPIPFPERNNGDLFDLLSEPTENHTPDGFLRTQQKCKKCGHILPETAKFCNACGSSILGIRMGPNNVVGLQEGSSTRVDNSRRRF